MFLAIDLSSTVVSRIEIFWTEFIRNGNICQEKKPEKNPERVQNP
jgi:hypothetical protein